MLDFAGGKSAVLSSSLQTFSPVEAFIYGSEGYVRLPTFHHPDRFVIQSPDCEPAVFEHPYRRPGFQYQIQEVHTCLRGGLNESQIMPLSDTLQVIRWMDQFRKSWGLTYPGEE